MLLLCGKLAKFSTSLCVNAGYSCRWASASGRHDVSLWTAVKGSETPLNIFPIVEQHLCRELVRWQGSEYDTIGGILKVHKIVTIAICVFVLYSLNRFARTNDVSTSKIYCVFDTAAHTKYGLC